MTLAAALLLAATTGAFMGPSDDTTDAAPAPRPVHAWRPVVDPGVAAPRLEGAPLSFDGTFDEAIVSWNVEVEDEDGFVVDVRVGRDGKWSPWLRIGSWGSGRPEVDPSTRFEGGAVDVDVFRSDERWDRLAWRVVAARRAVVRRIDVTVTDRSGAEVGRLAPAPAPFAPPPAPFRLDVPFRSQYDEAPDIRRKVCSPTSVAMVLEHHGVDVETAALAALLKDPDHGIYGNWARAVQGAFAHGVPGRLRRFSDWNDVRDALAAGRPLVASIGVNEGELTGAPYTRTRGHLLVLRGFDASGNVEVNDPAAETAEAGRTVYRRDELDRVWMLRGGTAYEIGAAR